MDIFRAGIIVVNAYGVEFVILEKRTDSVYMSALLDDTNKIVEVPINDMGVYEVLPGPYSDEIYMKMGPILKWYIELKLGDVPEIISAIYDNELSKIEQSEYTSIGNATLAEIHKNIITLRVSDDTHQHISSVLAVRMKSFHDTTKNVNSESNTESEELL